MTDRKPEWTDVVNVTGLTQMDQGWKKLHAGQRVHIKLNSGNKYDANATGVYLYSGEQIGWIPKAKNEKFAEHIKRYPGIYTAEVRKNAWYENDKYEDYSDILYIKVRTDIPVIKHDTWSTAVASSPNEYRTQPTYKPTPTKDKTMSTIDTLVNKNQDMAASAAFLEAGRIANVQATKLAAKHLPLMARGYADTPLGRLLLANAAVAAASKFRPTNRKLARLTEAMMVTAYQEVIQTFDIEKMIDEMLSSDTIKAAFNKLDEAAPAKE